MYTGLGYFYNHLLTHDTEARSQAREARIDAAGLRERLDRQALMSMALWSLMKDQFGLTDEQLLSRIQDIDLSDGKLDGKVMQGVTDCKKCKRSLSPRHAKCIYCGAVRETLPGM
jgi:hypothetical protein